MNPLEAALYVFVLSGGSQPLTCTLRTDSDVTCSNGIAVYQAADGAFRLSNGPLVRKTADGDLSFSTGLTVLRTSTGWMRFSNGLQVRRTAANLYRFDSGFVCIGVSAQEASCLKPAK